MARTRLALKIALVVLSIGIVSILALPKPQPHLRSCGHSENIWDRLTPLVGRWGPSHCCSSGSLVNGLKQIEAAQALYYDEHNTFATSLDQLTNHIRLPFRFACDFTGDKQRWSVTVPQQERFAGNYLFTSRGNLYFNASKAATTNDVELLHRK